MGTWLLKNQIDQLETNFDCVWFTVSWSITIQCHLHFIDGIENWRVRFLITDSVSLL